jgi:adenosylmethionine-8-amino-7-oxononanoate aminotransferase
MKLLLKWVTGVAIVLITSIVAIYVRTRGDYPVVIARLPGVVDTRCKSMLAAVEFQPGRLGATPVRVVGAEAQRRGVLFRVIGDVLHCYQCRDRHHHGCHAGGDPCGR